MKDIIHNASMRIQLHGQPGREERIFSDYNFNPLSWTDGYKFSQWTQYPTGLSHLMSYIESRVGSKHFKIPMLGLQPFLKEFLTRKITHNHVDWQKDFNKNYGAPFNEAGYRRIVDEFGGYWPVEIKAIPEGVVVGPEVPLLYIQETHPDFAWVVSPLETALLRAIWYPATIGAVSLFCREVIEKYLITSSDVDPDKLFPFLMNDFGARGATCHEAAMLGGMAFLLSGFQGTDNTEALHGLHVYYHDGLGKSGNTIPASEHSTATSFGSSLEDEVRFNSNMVKQYGDFPMFASVIDSFDSARNVTENWGGKNKAEVDSMKANLILRPDSGVPEVEAVKILCLIAETWGFTVNSKGYKVLPEKVRMIYGDGINEQSISTILSAVLRAGFSTENVALGMGGGLLQSVTRDTERWAMKACQIDTGTGPRPIGKNPVTDPSKASKFGPRWVYWNNGIEVLSEKDNSRREIMTTRYKNGLLLEDYTVDMVRKMIQLTKG